MNWVLVLVMYALLIFGVFMIESAARHLPISPEKVAEFGTAGAYFAWMQRNWIVIGSVGYFGAALIDYRWIRWLGIPLYAVSLALMVMAVQADDDIHRLSIAGLSFQPAQLGVTSGIIMIAWLMHDLPKMHSFLGNPFVRIGVIGLISVAPFLLVMKMGDMGSALVWIPVVIVSLLVAGIPFRFLSFIAFISAGVLPVLYFVILPLVSERGRIGLIFGCVCCKARKWISKAMAMPLTTYLWRSERLDGRVSGGKRRLGRDLFMTRDSFRIEPLTTISFSR